MAWKSREQKAEAKAAAATDDDKTYELFDAQGRRRYTVTGRNSAAAVAESTGYTARPKE